MAPIYEKLDVRVKKSIHNSFAKDIQAMRTNGEEFFLVFGKINLSELQFLICQIRIMEFCSQYSYKD